MAENSQNRSLAIEMNVVETEHVLQIVKKVIHRECGNNGVLTAEFDLLKQILTSSQSVADSTNSTGFLSSSSRNTLCNIITQLEYTESRELQFVFVEELVRKAGSEISTVKHQLHKKIADFIDEHNIFPESPKHGKFRVEFYLQNMETDWKSRMNLLSYLRLSPEFEIVEELLNGDSSLLKEYLLEISQHHVQRVKENLQKKYQAPVPKQRKLVAFSEDSYELQTLKVERVIREQMVSTCPSAKEECLVEMCSLVLQYMKEYDSGSAREVPPLVTSVLDLKVTNSEIRVQNSPGIFHTLRRLYLRRRGGQSEDRSLSSSVHESFDWGIFIRQVPMRSLKILWELEKSPMRMFAFGLDKGSSGITDMIHNHPILFTIIVSSIYLGIIFIWNFVRVCFCDRSLVRLSKNMTDEVVATVIGGLVGYLAQFLLPYFFNFSRGLVLLIAGVVCIIFSWLIYFHMDRFTQRLFHIPKDEALEIAYNTLGIRKTISNRELKKHYLQLLIKYHPETLQSKNMFAKKRKKKRAIKKFWRMEDAYEYVQVARGNQVLSSSANITDSHENGRCSCCVCFKCGCCSCSSDIGPRPRIRPLQYYKSILDQI